MDYFDKEKITDNMSDILDREYEKYQIWYISVCDIKM
jgi:hypothetical protein